SGKRENRMAWSYDRDTLDVEAIGLAVRFEGQVARSPVQGQQLPHFDTIGCDATRRDGNAFAFKAQCRTACITAFFDQ
ncbi:hypothetical protein NLO56_24590, partial [Escherichia coli]|nr:hypothetical protein [Escherichia coli]